MQVVKHRFAFCALTAFAALAASATDYYVATTGSDEADGLTAETAFATIDHALGVATDAADCVRVSPGTYTTITRWGPQVKCTLAGTGATRADVVIQPTDTNRTLRTTSTGCVTNLTIVGNSQSIIDKGAAVEMSGGTLVDCVVRAGSATGSGGNVYMYNSTAAKVRNCLISGGKAAGGHGGNVVLQGNGSVLEDSQIKDGTIGNIKERYGANVYVADASRLSRCTLTGGSHEYSADPNAASLVVNYASSAQVEDCLITGSTCGGAVLTGASQIYNTTIANNTGFGVWSWLKDQTFCNLVVFGNLTTAGANNDWAGNLPTDASVLNCAVTKGGRFAEGAYTSLVLLDDASCFADYANGDYRPSADGALANAGAADPRRQAASTTDVSGNPRTVITIDIGCYECQPTTFYATFDATLGGLEHPGETVAFIATSANADDADVSYTWNFGDGTDPVVTTEATATHVYAAGGLYTVTLTATSGNATFQQVRTDYVPVYEIVWVNANATPQIPYATEATGLKTIPEALAIHASKTGEVRIASGTYDVSAQQSLTSAIVVRGMGATPDDVIVTNTATATSKDQYKRVFEVKNADARVENLTMTGGQVYNQYGGNLRVAAGVVSNCVIRGGLVTANGGNAGGCGVEISGQGVVTHCWITNNVMSGTGSQTAWGSGAVLWTYGSKGKLYNSLVAYNTYIPSTVARGAAGIQMGGDNDLAVVENCTIVSNVVQGAITTAAGVWSDSSWYTTFRNCVIADNWQTASNACSSATFNGYTKVYNCVSDVAASRTQFYGDSTGFTIAALDSLFADFDGGDFTPKMGSALRNKGATPSVVAATDLAGNQRVFGRAIDVGCYELQKNPGMLLIVR